MAGGRGERTNDLFVDDDGLGSPTEEGQIRHTGGDLVAYLGGSVQSLTFTSAEHQALDQLVHGIAETSYQEITRTSGQVSDVIYWTDSGKTTKIREVNLTRAAGQVSVVVVKQYAAGVLSETLTGTITRTGGQTTSIDWVLT